MAQYGAARPAVRLPGGPPDQPRARRPPDRSAQPLARAVSARGGGRPDRERAQRQGLLGRADARRGATPRVGAQARVGLTRCLRCELLRPLSGRSDLVTADVLRDYLRNELSAPPGAHDPDAARPRVGVALVIAISALSRGLDRRAEDRARPALEHRHRPDRHARAAAGHAAAASAGRAADGGGGDRELSRRTSRRSPTSRSSASPGTHFVHDFFLPGHAADVPAEPGEQIAKLAGVAAGRERACRCSRVHQEGTVPKIVAKLKTGGQRLRSSGAIAAARPRPSSQKMQACFAEAAQRRAAAARRLGQRHGGGAGRRGGLGGGGGGARRPATAAAFAKCLPGEPAATSARTFTTPRADAPAGASTRRRPTSRARRTRSPASTRRARASASSPPSLVTKGRFLAPAGGNEALVSGSYAAGRTAEGRLEARPERDEVHGRRPRQPAARRSDRRRLPPAAAAADAREPEGPRERRARPRGGQRVGRRRCRRRSRQRFPQAQVASAKQVADQISGSLVDASNLSHRLGVALAIVAAVAAFLLAALLDALLGRQARARARDAEGARLDAAAGRPPGRRRVARARASLGGLARRRARGRVAALAIDAFGPTLTASSTTRRRRRLLRPRRGHRAHGQRPASRSTRRSRVACSLLGFGLALARRPARRRRRRVPGGTAAPRRRAEEVE